MAAAARPKRAVPTEVPKRHRRGSCGGAARGGGFRGRIHEFEVTRARHMAAQTQAGRLDRTWDTHRALSGPKAADPREQISGKFAEVCSRAEKPRGGVLTRADSARVLPGRSPASLARCSSGEACDTTVARRMRAAKLVSSAFQGKPIQ